MHASCENGAPVCPTAVLELVARFNLHSETYKQPTYNETQVRREFIDPLFAALGWDIDNEGGHAEAYKDVIHEDAIKVGGSTKAPDYCFRIGGVRKFFVEAKKPAEDIKQKRDHAYQLRRYAWTAKLPVSILTDFEEFAVFDCTKRPKPTDKASTGRILYVTFDEYAERWGDISSVFSKDAILKGAFDKYAESAKRKRGTAEVDSEFLKEIEQWRDMLARNIALRNPSLTVRELNYAVSKTIDRIIFLRMCEDRGVETYAQLRMLPNGPGIYPRMVELFRRADERYNSGLFHFDDEKGRTEAPDTLTPSLTIDDKVLKDIISRLYYPECPYEFSVMPSEILGQVYEQFLGKVITLTPGHRAKIEYKPEVKKAGGVYYTPKYIVDYIVEHTVGKLLEDKTPTDVGPMLDQRIPSHDRKGAVSTKRKRPARPLTILDPACGSGSFLLGAYQYLLDWHLRWYSDNDPQAWATKKNPPLFQSTILNPKSSIAPWRLTVAERKRILLNSIFGVDIDQQAVEVTKLSLLLKVLEGESQQTLDNQLRLFHERALPDLAANIKCGNSLIGPDFYDNQQMTLLDEEERYRINVFDWQAEFPDILKPSRDREGADNTTGFDAVIGNPPYDVLEKDRKDANWPHVALSSYVRSNLGYHDALGGKLNLFRFFLVRSMDLVAPSGAFGMIIPLAFLGDISCARTRRYIIRSLDHTVGDCFPQKDRPSRRVFRNAKLSTLVLTGTRRDPSTRTPESIEIRVYPWSIFSDRARTCSVSLLDAALLDEKNIPIPLVDQRDWDLCKRIHGAPDVAHFRNIDGVSITRGEINQTVYRQFITDNANMERLLKGVEVGRYRLHDTLSQGQREWFDESAFLTKFRARKTTHLRRIATQRITGVDEEWRIVATLVDPPAYFADSTNSIVCAQDCTYDARHILGLINSRLMQWRFKMTSTNNNVGTNELEALPFRMIDPENSKERSMHNRMVELVQQILELQNQLTVATTPTDKTAIQRQIDATDRQIDKLVYDLYGLTDDEVRIVEEATQR